MDGRSRSRANRALRGRRSRTMRRGSWATAWQRSRPGC